MEPDKIIPKNVGEKNNDNNDIIPALEEPDDQGMYVINEDQFNNNEANSPISSRSPCNKYIY